MSKPKRVTLTCSSGHSFPTDVYRSANVTTDPALHDLLRTGRFNRSRCPVCGEDVDAAVPFLYHDMSSGRIVWVYPAASANQADTIREKIRRSREIVGVMLPEPDPAPEAPRDVLFGIEQLLAWLDSQSS